MFSTQAFCPKSRSANRLKILCAMLADGTDKILRQRFPLVDIPAHLAAKALFAVGGRRLWLDVLLVIVIGQGGHVRENTRLRHLGYKEGMRAKVDGREHTSAHPCVCELRNIEQPVLRTVFLLAGLKLVAVCTALEAEVLKHPHGSLLCQERDVEQPRSDNHPMGIVALVDGDRDAVWRRGELRERVDDAAVVLVALAGGQNIQSVSDAAHGSAVNFRRRLCLLVILP